MRWPALTIVVVMLVAGCTDSAETADPASTMPTTPETVINADGIEVVTPVADPTPIDVSSAVRTGTLDNGLTYYARSNQSPGRGLSLRLVVNAGSLQQEVPESGVAHFLEHMLFNGTEQYPGNELTRELQNIGVLIGPDLNAYTSYDETVYSLELTSITDETVDFGFAVLAQWASAATLDQQATTAERGVVREEVRLRDEGPDGAIATVFDNAYLRGTAYEGREPGGRGDLVLATNADDVRRFYDRWYRPELMAVVAVGDLPVDRLEQEIKNRFSDLEPRGGDTPPRMEPEVPPIVIPITEVVSHPEVAAPFGSIDYSITAWDPGTVGGERLSLMQDVYALMIQNRLLDAVDRGAVELDDPGVGRFFQTRNQGFLGFHFDAPDLAEGTEFILSELRRLELSGFSNSEYERAAEQITTSLDQLLATAPSTSDSQYANGLAAHFLAGTQISSIADTHGRLTAALDEILASEVTNLFRWEMKRAAPIVIVVGSDASLLPVEADLQAAIEAAGIITAEGADAGDGPAIEVLMTRPELVEPVGTGPIDELGGFEWVFANGVTVRFIHSAISANQVDIHAVGQGGWSVLPEADAPLAVVASEAVIRSGVANYDRLAYRRFLAEVNTALFPFIDETSEGFFGSANSDDLEILFQRLYLTITAPRVEAPALRQTIDDADERRRLVETDTGAASQEALADLLYGGDRRFSLAPPDVSALTADRALDVYSRRFATVDDLVVAVVGDVGRREVATLAAAYLGTLPAGPADSWVDVRPPALDEVVRRDLLVGSGEATGSVSVLYPSDIVVDAATLVELQLLEQILDARLFDELREELGASYGGFVSAVTRLAPTEQIDILFFANVDPERVEETLAAVLAEAEDVSTNGPRAEELERARAVLQADFDLTNNFELIAMLLTEADEEILTYELRAKVLDAITAADLKALAAQVLPSDVRAEVVAIPA